MAKIRINKLPEGYKVENGKIIQKKNMGGATRSGDQKDYGLVSHPDSFQTSTSSFNPFGDVNNTLKAHPKDEATIEAEGGETALTDLNEDGKFELYKITGPRHSSGGVPLNLPPQSFIYSDTRDMLFNKDEMLEMGIESKKKLSPAKISMKYPLNEYIGKLDDVTSDKIAVDTAEYMMDKNKKKLSQLAFIQEAKKGFDEGVPSAAYPYLKLQGIDPIQFTQKVEGINEQEAKQKALAQMPLDQRQQIMALQGIMKQVQQQDLQEAQQAAGIQPQGQDPQGMSMPPQQGMMPPQAMMPPQQQMAPPMGMPMQPPPPMPSMRYGGEFQRGGAHEVDLNIFSLGECVGAGTCPQYSGGGTETELAAFIGGEGTNEENALFQAGLKAGIGSRNRSGFGAGISGEAGMQANMKDVLDSNMDPMPFYKGKLKVGYSDAPLYIGNSQYSGTNLGAYGEYDSNSGVNVGLEGGVGPISLRGGYNVNSKSPFLGAGLKINLQEGGEPGYVTPEVISKTLQDDFGFVNPEKIDSTTKIIDPSLLSSMTEQDFNKGLQTVIEGQDDIQNYLSAYYSGKDGEMGTEDDKEEIDFGQAAADLILKQVLPGGEDWYNDDFGYISANKSIINTAQGFMDEETSPYLDRPDNKRRSSSAMLMKLIHHPEFGGPIKDLLEKTISENDLNSFLQGKFNNATKGKKWVNNVLKVIGAGDVVDNPASVLEDAFKLDFNNEPKTEDPPVQNRKTSPPYAYGGYVPEYYAYGGDLPQAFWGKAMDYMQGGLSAVGMIPGIGNIADAANTAISGGRAAYAGYTGDDEAKKKHLGAMALNATAMIPGYGQMATAAKGAKGLKNVVKAVGDDAVKTMGQGYKKWGAHKAHDLAGTLKGGKDTLTGVTQGVNVAKKTATGVDAGTAAVDELAGTDSSTGFVNKAKKTVGKGIDAAGNYVADAVRPDQTAPGVDPVTTDTTGPQLVDATSGATQSATSTSTIPGLGEVPLASSTGPQPAPETTASMPEAPVEETPVASEPTVEEDEVVKYGGDPFAHANLKEFIYGGAQKGKEIPEGMDKETYDKIVAGNFTYDPETKTWSHPTYDQGYTNTMIDYYNKGYDVSGVTEGIGEEGIPNLQKKGTTESGATTYQGVSDAQVEAWVKANQYIIGGIKDDEGNPMFSEENPFTPTPDNVKLVQQGKNNYLDNLVKTNPKIKEKYTQDGEFNKEAFYKDYHGYFGEGATALDGKLGEYTVTDLGQQKAPEEPTPPVVINPQDKEEELDTIEPGDINTTTETERPDFWLQDKIKYSDLVSQKLGLRKYRPWAATFSPETIDATYVDPGRAIAAIQEQGKTAGDSSVFAGGAANRAMKLKAQGVAGKQISDVWAQNQEANLRSGAEAIKINTLIKNEAAEKNLAIHNQLYADNIHVDKEYDNALRDVNNKLANQLANSYTNMANTHNMNSLYPQFNVDPASGGFVDFTNPQELFANKNVDDRTKTERLADTIAELKKNNIDPKTLPKEVWNDLLAQSTDTGNSELEEVKAAITQGGYGGAGQTGMLGGYPGGQQAKYGREKANRLAKKGRELREWFSPLQGKWTD